MEIREADKAYAAGLMDGDGSINICIQQPGNGERFATYTPRVEFSLCDREPLEWLRQKWGGRLHFKKRPTARHRQVHFLYFRLSEIPPFLTDIRPYLIIKGPQADLVLDYLKHRSTNPRYGYANLITDEEVALRKSYWVACKSLNGRGDDLS